MTHFDSLLGVERVSEDSASCWQCLQAASHLDVETRATLYRHAQVFLPVVDDEDWLALYEAGLEQIDTLHPPSLQVAPLQAWARQLRQVYCEAAWTLLAERAARFPDPQRTAILAELLRRLVRPVPLGAVEPVGEQVKRLTAILTVFRQLPAAHRTTLIPNLACATWKLWRGAMALLQPDIDATLATQPLWRHASVVAEIAAGTLGTDARAWVLAQIKSLTQAQVRCALEGEAPVPYRAEILRRLLLGMTRSGHALESSPRWALMPHWPAVREALMQSEAGHRELVIKQLEAMLPELDRGMRNEAEALLATLSAPAAEPGQDTIAEPNPRKRRASQG